MKPLKYQNNLLLDCYFDANGPLQNVDWKSKMAASEGQSFCIKLYTSCVYIYIYINQKINKSLLSMSRLIKRSIENDKTMVKSKKTWTYNS